MELIKNKKIERKEINKDENNENENELCLYNNLPVILIILIIIGIEFIIIFTS